ncbi:histone H2A-beta, sperm-like [Pelobates fuscus]|uniref:histone H2A-beta, sperm-like n=1 Tax=Pelobates fuscus TaxID=191477 RepID=UPI002FE487EA
MVGRGTTNRIPLRRSRSFLAGLCFPVSRVHRQLCKWSYSDRVNALAPVYLAAVLQYLSLEILHLAVHAARNKTRIFPRHILYALRNDTDLGTLTGPVIIAHSLLYKKKQQSVYLNNKSYPVKTAQKQPCGGEICAIKLHRMPRNYLQ